MNGEVRSCPKCGQASVVQVFEWQHTAYGSATGQVTRELRCQSCAAWYVVRPFLQILPLWIAGGVLTLATCVGGIPFLLLAFWRTGVEKKVPVVPGAPMPPIRFRGGPPLRVCGSCRGVATAIRITRNSHNGVPTGTEYEYQCGACSAAFVIESWLGQTFSGVGGLFLIGVAATFLFSSQSPGWKYGGSGVCTLLALVLLGQVGKRLLNRFQNPPLQESVVAGLPPPIG